MCLQVLNCNLITSTREIKKSITCLLGKGLVIPALGLDRHDTPEDILGLDQGHILQGETKQGQVEEGRIVDHLCLGEGDMLAAAMPQKKVIVWEYLA